MIKDDAIQYAIDNGIIDAQEVLIAVESMKRKELLAKHPYSIWQNKDGKWLTYLYDEEGNKQIRRRNSKEDLEEFLVEYYRKKVHEIYLKDMFEMWIKEKIEYGEIQKQSYDRYRTDFLRFFKTDASVCRKQFRNINELDLEDHLKRLIKENGLTRKVFSGVVTILNGTFKYGKKHGYTDFSISGFFGDLQIPKSIFKRKTVEKRNEVFDEDETSRVISYLRENADIWNLGLLLQFQTGMRIGEIAALKREDVENDCIHVRRTEIKVKDEEDHCSVSVSELTKTEAGCREIIIPSKTRWTLDKILELNPNGEYLFMSNGIRVRETTFNKRLERVCDKLGIQRRSTHKIRKTYGTALLDGGVNDSFVAEQMGHTDVATTRKLYYYSNKNRVNKKNQIENAIDF